MARIVGGNPQGEFRGKLGGLVYSRNRSGQIVRNYAKPIDPRSEAQISARSAFAQAMSGFHTLSPDLKSAWNNFASQYFTSKGRGNVPHVHSGANAFVALRNNLLNAQRLTEDVSNIVLEKDGVPVTNLAQAPIVLTSSAPLGVMEGVLDGGNYVINSVTGINLPSATAIQFSLNVTGQGTGPLPSPPTSTGSILTDGNGYFVGFNVYVSNMLVQDGVQVSNPDVLLLSSTGLIDTYTTPDASTSQLTFSLPIKTSAEKTQYYPTISGYYEVSIWMFNSQGQTIRLGAEIVQAN